MGVTLISDMTGRRRCRRLPATIFYNKFISDVNRQAQRLEGFADEFAAILSRQIDERG